MTSRLLALLLCLIGVALTIDGTAYVRRTFILGPAEIEVVLGLLLAVAGYLLLRKSVTDKAGR